MNRGRKYLRDVAVRHGVAMFETVEAAVDELVFVHEINWVAESVEAARRLLLQSTFGT